MINTMQNQFSRTKILLGTKSIERLLASRVAVFGIGGVGSYAAEALVRAGVGAIDLIDDDKVCLTNLNRQLFATRKTVGMQKTEAAKERLSEINPGCQITLHNTFFMPETAGLFDFRLYDYVIDAIDTVTGKIELCMRCQAVGTPVISAMGAGNKLDASAFRVADISKTSVCPLARVMRKELRQRGVKSLKVVYSQEEPLPPAEDPLAPCRFHCVCPPGTQRKCTERRQIPGSVSFVPPVVGMILAGEVIKELTTRDA
jgi:tRNA A37 threonylcarbamoyladenosine dehydratase